MVFVCVEGRICVESVFLLRCVVFRSVPFIPALRAVVCGCSAGESIVCVSAPDAECEEVIA